MQQSLQTSCSPIIHTLETEVQPIQAPTHSIILPNTEPRPVLISKEEITSQDIQEPCQSKSGFIVTSSSISLHSPAKQIEETKFGFSAYSGITLNSLEILSARPQTYSKEIALCLKNTWRPAVSTEAAKCLDVIGISASKNMKVDLDFTDNVRSLADIQTIFNRERYTLNLFNTQSNISSGSCMADNFVSEILQPKRSRPFIDSIIASKISEISMSKVINLYLAVPGTDSVWGPLPKIAPTPDILALNLYKINDSQLAPCHAVKNEFELINHSISEVVKTQQQIMQKIGQTNTEAEVLKAKLQMEQIKNEYMEKDSIRANEVHQWKIKQLEERVEALEKANKLLQEQKSKSFLETFNEYIKNIQSIYQAVKNTYTAIKSSTPTNQN